MDEPKSLDELFKGKIFRIPDYQRGYAWQISQLKDFWEDLVNLPDGRSHYTGVLTLKETEKEIAKSDDEYWLVEDHSYKIFHIVDGQQRLTTIIIFLQALIDVVRKIEDNVGKSERDIFISDTLTLADMIGKYLYKIKPSGLIKTYKFGYMVDNPSYKYLKHKIFDEAGAGSINDTFYTLNLCNARNYFQDQIKALLVENGFASIQEIYKKLTKYFLFNEYVIKNEFDVFIAFETMNNRGKKLSDLELLKNRLIYLTTLYTDEELDTAERRKLRDAINNTWKEVYHQLGRNKQSPLNDDDFLKAHWIMYFRYTKKRGDDYIRFLLDEQFSAHNIYQTIAQKTALEDAEELRTEDETDDGEEEADEVEETPIMPADRLPPREIKNYVNNLKESAIHWFNSYYPHLATELSDCEQVALSRLNRLGMGHFRPLIVSIFKNEKDPKKRVDVLQDIERFIFINFRLCRANSNYRSSEFYNAAREFGEGKLNVDCIKEKLKNAALWCFQDDGTTLNHKYFHDHLYKSFTGGAKNGYYGWSGLRYFLYEYELKLLRDSHHEEKKVHWENLTKTPPKEISIEHIAPQAPTDEWKADFAGVAESDYYHYCGSIGNFLLLSRSINSALQNFSFANKKHPKFDDNGNAIRGGYSNGSYSEIEVANSGNEKWTPKRIETRGMQLLEFMAERWDFRFESEQAKRALLFLNPEA